MFTAIPISKNKLASFRRVIKSSDFNDNQEKVLYDILELYNKANSLNSELNNALVITNYENKFLRRKLQAVENKLNELISNKSTNIVSIFASEMKSNEDYPVEINHMSYDISQNIIKRISKINIYDEISEKTIIPETLNVDFKILNKTNSYLKFISNDIYYAFDEAPETSWIYNITTNNSINDVSVEIIITLPTSSVTSYEINEILLESFPVSSINIKELQYRSSYQNWTDIPSFNEHCNNNGNGIFDNTVSRFNFKPVNASQIRIVLQQNYYTVNNNLREFCIGAKNIQINYAKPTNQECFFDFIINVPSNIETPILSEANIIYNNPSQIDNNVVDLEYFYRDSDDILHKINGHLPLAISSKQIEVKGKMYESDNIVNLSHIDFIIKE